MAHRAAWRQTLTHLDAQAFDERLDFGMSRIRASLRTQADVTNSTPGKKAQ